MLISGVLLLDCAYVLSQKFYLGNLTCPEGKERKETEALLKLASAEAEDCKLSASSTSVARVRYLGPDDVLITLNVWHGVEVALVHGAVCVRLAGLPTI